MAAFQSRFHRLWMFSTHFIHRRKMRSAIRNPLSSSLNAASVHRSRWLYTRMVSCSHMLTTETRALSSAALWSVNTCFTARQLPEMGTEGCTRCQTFGSGASLVDALGEYAVRCKR
jgi:hypothetical protein